MITTWGWGSGAISTSGWGSSAIVEFIASILTTKYLCDKDAYTCVITRDYLEIKTREKGEIVLRLKPDSIPARTWDVLLSRSKGEISFRNVC
jgi:hypothetical protein